MHLLIENWRLFVSGILIQATGWQEWSKELSMWQLLLCKEQLDQLDSQIEIAVNIAGSAHSLSQKLHLYLLELYVIR